MIVCEKSRNALDGVENEFSSTSPDALAKLGYVFNELGHLTERARVIANNEDVVSQSDVIFMKDTAQALLGDQLAGVRPLGDLARAVESLGQDVESFPSEIRQRFGNILDQLGNATAVATQLMVQGTFATEDVGTIFDGAAMLLSYYPYDGSLAAPGTNSRVIESPAMLEARLERYVADGIDRKLLNSFARDFCTCARDAQRPFTHATGDSYVTVFERFALREAAGEIKRSLGISA